MDIPELRATARKYIESVTASNQRPFTLPHGSFSQDGQPIGLASLIESLDLQGIETDRLQLFEKIVVLRTRFLEEEGAGADPENVSSLRKWVAKVILPSEAFAELSPYSIVEERPLIAPDIVAKEQALNFQGLLLLSRLPKDVPLDSDDSTVPVFSCLASFSDESDPWTSPKTQELACSLAKEYAVPDHLPALLHGLLQERIKPLFAKSKNPAITQQGRKAIDPLPSNGTAHGDLDTESKPWKYRDVYIVTVFRWILKHLDEKPIEANWPLIIPPLLALIDDTSVRYKAKGCHCLWLFLQKCPSPLLERTGLGEVFENAVTPCLMYLPSLTDEAESMQLLSAAYPTLIELARVRFAGQRQRTARLYALDRILREGVFEGYTHAGEHVKITELLVNQMTKMINGMGIASAKHLKQILPLLSETLVAPFATAYPPLLQASIKSVEAVLINDWPRISYYRGEILRGLTTCWCRIKDQETIPMELTKVQQSIKRALQLLRSLLKADIHVAEEFQILMASDDRLHDLVTV